MFINKSLIKNWLGITLFIIGPIFIFIMVVFGLIDKNQFKNVAWGYVYLVICFCFYVLVITMILWITIAANSIFIFIKQEHIILLDEIIQINNLISIEFNLYFHKLKYKHDGDNLHDVKTICTKSSAQIFEMLLALKDMRQKVQK